jgi:hypothetical protein
MHVAGYGFFGVQLWRIRSQKDSNSEFMETIGIAFQVVGKAEGNLHNSEPFCSAGDIVALQLSTVGQTMTFVQPEER